MLHDIGAQSAALEISVADRLATGLELLERESVDLVLLDMSLQTAAVFRLLHRCTPPRQKYRSLS
jgi:DNA-binding response OmpR family regulator